MSHSEQLREQDLRPPSGPIEQGEAALEAIYGAGVLPGLDLSSLPESFQTLLGGNADPRDRAVQEQVLDHLQSTDGAATRRLLEMLIGKPELDQLLAAPASTDAASESSPDLRAKLEQALVGLTSGSARKDIRKNAARLHFGKVEPIRREETRVGRNDACPCGSGKKFKQCCLRKKD